MKEGETELLATNKELNAMCSNTVKVLF